MDPELEAALRQWYAADTEKSLAAATNRLVTEIEKALPDVRAWVPEFEEE